MPDTNPVRWQPDRSAPATTWPVPALLPALARGFAGRCPACGKARLFSGWLRVVPECPVCTAPVGAMRADDAPPYFTIFIVGHFVIALMVLLDLFRQMPIALELAIFLPFTALMSLALLRPIKGATVGLMLRLGMDRPGEAA